MNKTKMFASKEITTIAKALNRADAINKAIFEAFVDNGYPMSKKFKAWLGSSDKLFEQALRIVERLG